MITLAGLCLRAPVLACTVLGILTALLGAGAMRLEPEFGYRPLLGNSHPSIQELDGFIETFGGGFPLLIVWECSGNAPCKSALDVHALAMANTVYHDLIDVQGVQGVHSPANTLIPVATDHGFAQKRAWENDGPAEDLEVLTKQATADPMWIGTLISQDASVGSIVVHLRDSRSSTMEHVVDAIDVSLDPFREMGFEYHLAGHPIESVIAGRDLAKSTNALTPLTALIIAAVVLGLTRSWLAVGITMGGMGVSLVWTFGALGWLGWPQDSVLQVLAPLILIVGVCDAVHLLSRYAFHAAASPDRSRVAREKAVRASVADVAAPCVVTTMTTGGAFLSFLTSDLATFVRFGVISALGVAACLIVTFTLVPICIAWLPAPRRSAQWASRTWARSLSGIANAAQTRAPTILMATGFLFVACGYGWVAHLEVDTDPTTMWGDKNRVTKWIRFVDTRLRGLDSLEIAIRLPSSASIADPEILSKVKAFQSFLEQTDGLGRSTSVHTLISRANRLLHDDSPDFDRAGETLQENAEILATIEWGGRDLLLPWLSLDHSEIRISAEGPSDSAKGRGRVIELVEAYADSNLPANWDLTITGPFAMEFDWVTQMQDTQLRSFGAAFLIVYALVALFFGSATLGLVAMVPALAPVVVTLGFMGFAGLSLDVGRVMIAAIVIGIGVDDSVHLIQHYVRRRALGDSRRNASHSSVIEVGRAVVVTSAALALGFLTLMTSAWQSISSFGFFVTVAITGALAGALLVLPAILSIGSPSGTADE